MNLRVSGMSCQKCVEHVTKALQTLEGVTAVTVNLAEGTVELQGEPHLEQVKAALEEEGYTVLS